MKKLKVAIIGAGMMGNQHIEAIRRIPNTEIVALSDENIDNAVNICKAKGITKSFNDYKIMLDECHPDVVHNCTPNHLHYPINVEVINRGINVYCEKPLALNSRETLELCTLAERVGVKAGVNFNYRQNVMVREMHERIMSQNGCPQWGRTFLIHGCYLQDWMIVDTDFNWRCLSKYSGSTRTVADIGSHWFDCLQYITGHKVKRVNAQFSKVWQQRKRIINVKSEVGKENAKNKFDLVDIDTEDAAMILFEMDDGTKGETVLSQISAGTKNNLIICIDGSNYSMNWCQERPDRLTISTRYQPDMTIYAGEEMLHGDARRYASFPSGHPVGWQEALKNGIQEFYADIRGECNKNYADFRDGDCIMRIVEACAESSKKRRWIDVKE